MGPSVPTPFKEESASEVDIVVLGYIIMKETSFILLVYKQVMGPIHGLIKGWRPGTFVPRAKE